MRNPSAASAMRIGLPHPGSSAGSGNSRSSTGTWGAGITAATILGKGVEYPMPLFEYECRGCGHRFEYLTRDGQSPSCPSCQSAELQKLMSVFAAQSSSPAKSFSDRPMSACGSCGDPRGPGACSMN